jgi:hypothetical protein
MISSNHTISTTASKILSKSDSNRHVYLHVTGNTTVYIGGSNVTTVNGLATEKHTTPIDLFIPDQEEMWAVVETGTTDLRIMYAPSQSGDA